eukprot:scaffold25618_cov57-Attheya_sp.AAC.5
MASNPCYALLWLILLFFIAWPVAGLSAGLWVFLQIDDSIKDLGWVGYLCIHEYISGGKTRCHFLI